jgi:RNA polymerase sigma factor (sigma-70 family)
MSPGTLSAMERENDRRLSQVIAREQARLLRFIRRRVPDPRDAEDVLQDVFFELVEANRLLMPIEHVGGWLFRVARNRIVDLFRTRRHETPQGIGTRGSEDEDESPRFEELLPSPDDGPEAAYLRRLVLEELESAIAELPEEQRAVFVAHELEGLSFKEMSARTGVGVNTLLSRKRYAVLRLRERLRTTYEELWR